MFRSIKYSCDGEGGVLLVVCFCSRTPSSDTTSIQEIGKRITRTTGTTIETYHWQQSEQEIATDRHLQVQEIERHRHLQVQELKRNQHHLVKSSFFQQVSERSRGSSIAEDEEKDEEAKVMRLAKRARRNTSTTFDTYLSRSRVLVVCCCSPTPSVTNSIGASCSQKRRRRCESGD